MRDSGQHRFIFRSGVSELNKYVYNLPLCCVWLCPDLCTSCLEAVVVEVEGVGEGASKEVALLAQAEILRWGSHLLIYRQSHVKQMHCTQYGWRPCLLLRDNLLIPFSTQPLDPLPVLSDFSTEEKKICELQTSFITRLRKSPYYVVETIKPNGQVAFTCAHLVLIHWNRP